MQKHIEPSLHEIASAISTCILYQDEHMLVVNKPSGLVMSAPGGRSLSGMLHEVGYSSHYVVHRLDALTSGLVLIALNKASAADLCRQFREREIDKVYEAVLYTTHPSTIRNGYLTHRLAKQGRRTQCAVEGQTALSLVNVHGESLNAFDEYGGHLVQASMFPITGRTHQLRVHAASVMQAPILGDPKYGLQGKTFGLGRKEPSAQHMHLHAAKICFHHPSTGKKIVISAPLPLHMKQTIARHEIKSSYEWPVGSEDMIRGMKEEVLWWVVRGKKSELLRSLG